MRGYRAEIRKMRDADVDGMTVLVRVDYNVPLQDGTVGDDERIRASLPTLDALLNGGAKLVLVTHLGRPEGQHVPALRLDPVAERLQELLGRPVRKLADCIGEAVRVAIDEARPGDVILLENVRFHRGETTNETGFARELAGLADLFVNDAFATLHRAHASTVGVADHLPSYAGLLMQREIEALSRLMDDPERPYVAIIGGKKARSKLGPLRDLLGRVDEILVGGGVAWTFVRAMGGSVGDSMLDEDLLDDVQEIVRLAEERGVKIHLPVDAVVAEGLAEGGQTQVVDARDIPAAWMGLDIGPETVRQFTERIDAAKTVVWTGPMGVFEQAAFAEGTKAVAHALAASEAYSVIGGGETGEAVARLGLADRVSYVSTGGGACLALLRGKSLPALDALCVPSVA